MARESERQRHSARNPATTACDGARTIIGEPGTFPFTRGIRADMYRGRLWTMRQYAGFAKRRRIERALPLFAGARRRPGLSVAFDLADATRLRLRRAASARRSRQSRRGDRHDRRHGNASRRDPARPRHRLDDDQRAGGDSARARTGGRAPARDPFRATRRHRCRTTSSKSTSRAAPTSFRPVRRCVWSPT